MNLAERISRLVNQLLAKELAGITPAQTQKRAIHIDQLFEQLRMWSYDNYGIGYLTSFYIEDDGTMYAIFDNAGKLYRAQVSVTGNDVTVGDLEEVQATYEPVSRSSSFTLKRQADGNYRFSMIACTAVVNRDGEIDSTTLFDNMIKRAEEMDFYPRVDFFHLGELSPERFEFGQVDVLAREGIAYIASGTLQGDHPLTRAIVKAHEEGSETWGASIEYYPFTDSEQLIDVGDQQIRMYTDGINTRIAILPEQQACSQFTALAVKRMSDMNQKQREALVKALGEEEANKLIDAANLRTKEADDKGLIYRTGEGGQGQANSQAPAADTNQEGSQDDQTVQEIELDDSTIDLIAERVAAKLSAAAPAQSEQVAEVARSVGEIQTTLNLAVKDIGDIIAAVNDLQEDEEEKRRQWLADLPREKLRITHRPRLARAQPEQEEGMSEELELEVHQIADQALAGLGWQ